MVIPGSRVLKPRQSYIHFYSIAWIIRILGRVTKHSDFSHYSAKGTF